MVGAYTSESTPPATVYQILEVVLRAVPRQSLRARPKWLVAPGPSVAVVDALAGATGTNIAAATVAAATSTVEVLLIIPMAHSLCPSTVTTVPMPVNLLPAARVCQCVSSPLSQNQGVGRRRGVTRWAGSRTSEAVSHRGRAEMNPQEFAVRGAQPEEQIPVTTTTTR